MPRTPSKPAADGFFSGPPLLGHATVVQGPLGELPGGACVNLRRPPSGEPASEPAYRVVEVGIKNELPCAMTRPGSPAPSTL